MNIVASLTTSRPITKGRFENLSADKLRGGYYTPKAVAEWLTQWAVRKAADMVLEPSAGDGSFLEAAASRLLALGAEPAEAASQIKGVELLDSEAKAAGERLTRTLGACGKSAIVDGDFFGWREKQRGMFDVVVGNPPFIRYQSFPEPARGRAMALMERAGFKPNRLTNIWVPFVVAAAEALKPGGRLAMVIPAELLQVTYAAQLRVYLAERFKHIDVVACNELFFDGAEQEVLLLLADGARDPDRARTACRVAFTEADTVAEVTRSVPKDLLAKAEEKDVRGDKEKWLKYFLSAREIGLMRELRTHDRIVDMGRLAEVDVGIVTGANEFFILRRSEIARRKLGKLIKRTISRSAHIRGAVLTDADWIALDDGDERVHIVDIRQNARGEVPAAAAAYIQDGEDRGLHTGYKCSIRKPWYHVPTMWAPDAFLFRQIHDFPRIVLNQAGATATDTIHRVRARAGISASDISAAAFTHLTGASAEIEGRSYGGGVLELEPTEAERLLMPDAKALAAAIPLAEADEMIRKGKIAALLEANDAKVLRGELGLSVADCNTLKAAWLRMQGRRFNRGRKSKAHASSV